MGDKMVKKVILVSLLCISIGISGISFFKYQEMDKEVKDRTKEIEKANKEKNDNEEEIKKMEAQKLELQENKKEEIKVYEKWKEKVGNIESLL